ncbi:sensor histidine kinase [Paenibacillus sp. PAMC21692]|uniref:sensor histidine kinase n=1 Tax=Paenibacillus sp. PAMC21692 TaxID=2762320 RepID=UPI00164D4EE9|nr:histidine kinase [Paenibacillus sp. PAMC21692]QNK55924.1 histidine kinase [Paenibacillus sp. PAMC21692]
MLTRMLAGFKRSIRQSMFVRVLLVHLLISSILVLILGQIIISQVNNRVLEGEYRYQHIVLSGWQNAIQERLSSIKNWTRSLYSENYMGVSVLDQILLYDKGNNAENLARGTSINHFLNSLANSINGVPSVFFVRSSDEKLFYYMKNSGYVNGNFPDFVRQHYEFEKDEYVKVVPNESHYVMPRTNKGVLSIFLAVNDIQTLDRQVQVGTLIVNLDVAFLTSQSLGNVHAVQYENAFGKVIYPPAKEDELESSSFLNIKQNNPKGDIQLSSWISKELLFKESKAIQKVLWGLLAILFLLTLLLTVYTTRKISVRLAVIRKAMNRIDQGNFSEIHITTFDEFAEIERMFNKMSLHLSDYINREYLFEIEARNVEIQSLQAQINPHFLSNTLEIFRMQALKQNDIQMSDMLYDLSEFYRWNVKNRNTLVPIYEEFHYIELYLRLQLTKLENVQYTLDMDDEVSEYLIAKLSVQPIVENIFKHAKFADKQDARIELAVWGERDSIYLRISDNGCGMDAERLAAVRAFMERMGDDDDQQSVGLMNVHRRLKLLFNGKYQMELDSAVGIGTTMTLTIPKTS